MRAWMLPLFAVGIVGAAASMVWARGRKPPAHPHPVHVEAPRFSSWAAHWDGPRARQALFVNASHLEEVDLFAYHFAADDSLKPAHANFKNLSESFRQLPGRKPRLAITIVNDVENAGSILLKDPACVHRVVSTAAARDAHIQQILFIAEEAESIDIDYERVAPEDSRDFTTFIRALAAALHQKNKRLSVVVEPRISDQRTSDPLSNANSTLSWHDIAAAADQLTVMAYLYHYGSSGPGSIAPLDWVRQIAEYGLQSVPADKLSIALHLGGYDWPKGVSGKSLEFDKASALAAAYGTSIKLDAQTQSGTFTYSDGSSTHEVWVETAAGLRAKIKALSEAGIYHIALWRLGAGDPAFWDKLPVK